MRLHIRVFLLALLAFSAVATSMPCYAEDSRILRIRQLYEETQKRIMEGDLLETVVDTVANEKFSDRLVGGIDFGPPVYRFYSDNGVLAKAVVHSASGGIMHPTEYLYYPDGGLAFYFVKHVEALDEKVLYEERFYFAGQVLIRYSMNKEVHEGKMPAEAVKTSQHLLDKAIRLKRAFFAILDLE